MIRIFSYSLLLFNPEIFIITGTQEVVGHLFERLKC